MTSYVLCNLIGSANIPAELTETWLHLPYLYVFSPLRVLRAREIRMAGETNVVLCASLGTRPSWKRTAAVSSLESWSGRIQTAWSGVCPLGWQVFFQQQRCLPITLTAVLQAVAKAFHLRLVHCGPVIALAVAGAEAPD